MEDKIDIYDSERAYRKIVEKTKNSPTIHPENKIWILKYLQDSELGKTILKGQKRKIGARRNYRAATYLRQLDGWLKKPFPQVTIKEMEDLIYKLDEGIIKANTGQKYKSEALATLKNFLRKFYKWLLGDSKVYPPLVDWIDCSFKRADRATLCKRFGWQYSSDVPDRYIDMNQVNDDKTVQAVRAFEASGSGRSELAGAQAMLPRVGSQPVLNEELLRKLVQVEERLAQLGATQLSPAGSVPEPGGPGR